MREIRTPEPLLTVTRFPGVPLQPLEHHSNCVWVECTKRGVHSPVSGAKIAKLLTLCNFMGYFLFFCEPNEGLHYASHGEVGDECQP